MPVRPSPARSRKSSKQMVVDWREPTTVWSKILRTANDHVASAWHISTGWQHPDIGTDDNYHEGQRDTRYYSFHIKITFTYIYIHAAVLSRILIEVHAVASSLLVLDKLKVVCTQTKGTQNAVAQTF